MNILQFQFTRITDKERDIFEDFCYWLCDQMFTYINTKMNRKRLYLKLNYLYNVNWIVWIDKKFLDVSDIMEAIHKSFTVKEYKDNLWKIYIDNNILIPNTYTSISRLIRFLNYGDLNNRGIGMFTKLQQNFRHQKLNSLWKIYAMNRLGIYSNIKIIAE